MLVFVLAIAGVLATVAGCPSTMVASAACRNIMCMLEDFSEENSAMDAVVARP